MVITMLGDIEKQTLSDFPYLTTLLLHFFLSIALSFEFLVFFYFLIFFILSIHPISGKVYVFYFY
jgi:hypothetical protein